MTYEELLISIDINGYDNVLPIVGKTYLDDYWFIVCDDGDCHLFDRYGKEDDISKVKEINYDIILQDIKKIVIPNSVTDIDCVAFSNCWKLTSVTIPNSVMSIGNQAFYGCCGLTSMNIPDSVTSIGDGAFWGCSKLKNVTIPNSVTSIRDYAFYDCSRLVSMMIPDNVISIGKYAFKWCDNLKKIVFKSKSFDQVKSMNNYPFGIKDESIIRCN